MATLSTIHSQRQNFNGERVLLDTVQKVSNGTRVQSVTYKGIDNSGVEVSGVARPYFVSGQVNYTITER